MIKNYMEFVVDQVLQDLEREHGTQFFKCRCEACMDSIRAYTLNHLQPFYITTKVGEVYGGFNDKELQNHADILAEVMRAKLVVEQNPKHSI